MVVCELDKEVSGEILGWKLTAWQALLVHRVMPSCGGFAVYLSLMCYDFALVTEHFINGDKALGAFCLILMILPALISLVFTLASPPTGLQTEPSAFTANVEKNDVYWILKQLTNTLFFPAAALGRYCFLIFWWIEAVCASYAEDKERTQEALIRAREPSSMELYLFLQSFLHAAPHTIFNILNLIARFQTVTFDRALIQAISIVMSSLRMASTATMYRRFEREKLNGRKYPWNEYDKKALKENMSKENIEQMATDIKDNNEPIYGTFIKKEQIVLPDSIIKNEFSNDLIQLSPRNTEQLFVDDDSYFSDTSSGYLPPVPSNRNSRTESDDEYLRPISIIDKTAPRRRETYTIERVSITPPPIMPAPRPGSLAVWAEKIVENAEALPNMLSAPPRRKYHVEVIKDEPNIPRRVPRSYMRGLEPQDATAALVHFLGWYSFFVARLLSIACFIQFFPVAAIIVLFSHYQLMLLLLIVPQASTVKRAFYIFLAFIYLFCLMEFKIRFRHVRVWHMFWIILCTVEIILFTSLWASIDNSLESWWRNFVVIVTFVSMLLSYICFLVYFILLQPRETIVYIHNKNNNS